jgi:hypothetical protein
MSGEPGCSSDPGIDSFEGKLAIAAANQQSGLEAALRGQQCDNFRLHTGCAASCVPERGHRKISQLRTAADLQVTQIVGG